MSAARVVGQGQKRAFGVAKRLREISSDQARCQKAYFLEKAKESGKHSLFEQILGSNPFHTT